MTKNLADNLGPHGINVNVIHPGLTYTERSDSGIEKIAKKENISFDESFLPQELDGLLDPLGGGRNLPVQFLPGAAGIWNRLPQ